MDDIAEWLAQNSESMRVNLSTMKASEFLDRCKDAGCQVKQSGHGGGWVVTNRGKGSIKFSQSSRQFSWNTVRSYLHTLGLSVSSSGILGSEFQDGVSDEREEIHRYISALRRLAKT